MALKIVGFEPVWEATRTTRVVADGISPIATARRVRRWARWVPTTRLCLPQAFATAVLLRRQGQNGELVIGVRHGPFEAHAWVVHDGEVLIGGEEQPGYTPIWSGAF